MLFRRAYSIEEAIDSFLSHVYEPSLMEGRFDYIPADSSAESLYITENLLIAIMQQILLQETY
ncbi:hypothetical protein [Paracerasibacillus soli]|uniref:Uncharacterized protein n=1 Tax=Paracerasibacillus soli TaxID=480284 RepID=A0ABU5CXL7_9BACI|nr:hypothetical protein [Virgibacillus soli]MDY0410609.1 hypothetical protein [Virgibacillus soli]